MQFIVSLLVLRNLCKWGILGFYSDKDIAVKGRDNQKESEREEEIDRGNSERELQSRQGECITA